MGRAHLAIDTRARGCATRAMVDLSLSIDGALVSNPGFRRLSPEGTKIENWSVAVTANLSAGTHQISLAASQFDGVNYAVVSGNNSSVLQGALSVVILKR